MNYLGLTVFAGTTAGIILDFDSATKQYTVEFEDGRVIKTATVYWDDSIPADKEVALYRKASLGNGERLLFEASYGWDIVSQEDNDDDMCEKCGGDGCSHCNHTGYLVSRVAKPLEIDDQPLEITEEPSDLNDWVDDYTAEGEEDSKSMSDKLDEVLDTLNELKDKGDIDPSDKSEEYDPVQKQDHDATEDSYWDRTLKPNPMAMDNEFGSGEYNERNDGALPGGRAMAAKVAKDCDCWEGYKRVPGTKPCAPGSCEKCDAGRKESAAKKQSPEEAVKKVNTVPSAGVRAAAKRGLKYYEDGKAGDGFEAATADRARRIAAGEKLTEEHINRMHSFFERHAGGRSKKAKPGEITAWDVAWLCWGGDAGRSWAAKVDAQLHKARHPNSKGKHSVEIKVAEDAGAGVFNFDNNEDDTDHMRSDIGGNSNVRHAEGEVQKNMDDAGMHDQEGNPELRGLGDDDSDPDIGDGDVTFPTPPVDLTDTIIDQTKDLSNPNEEVWEKVHSHVREESDWMDAHYAKGLDCPTCSDPLVNGNCYVCGENKRKEAKAIAKKKMQINKIAKALSPRAAELGTLFGEALAGTRKSVTEPSEDIFTVHIDGQDSDPSIGGTGGYNLEHGDSPELLKDVDGYAGFIDATPNLVIEGMPKVIEMSESDESGEDNPIIKALEKVLDISLGDVFTEHKEEAKKNKESSLQSLSYGDASSTGTTDDYCNLCNKKFIPGRCNISTDSPAEAPEGCEAIRSSGSYQSDQTPPMSQSQTQPIGYATSNPPAAARGYATGIPGALSAVQDGFDLIQEEFDPSEEVAESEPSGGIMDIDDNPLEVGKTYRVFAGVDSAPEVVKVVDVSDSRVSVVRVDSAFPENEGEPYDISKEQAEVEDIRFDKADTLNPNEIGMDSAPPTDGTPETMDDAGPGQNDIPGVTDLSNAHMAGIKEAGRHYLPNQQREFINEPGKARNLDKLMLEGTHYVDGEVTASDNFDDDFLFGV